MIYLDTHVAVGLAEGRQGLLSRVGRKAIESESDIRISPMAYLEIECLYEIRRLRLRADDVLAPLIREIGLRVCETSFATVTREAFVDAWTHDPFDRLIVAQARVHKAKLLTLDEKIKRYYPLALE